MLHNARADARRCKKKGRGAVCANESKPDLAAMNKLSRSGEMTFAPRGLYQATIAAVSLAAAGGIDAAETTKTKNAVVQEDTWTAERASMVAGQIYARGVRDPRVLEALRTVPRHRFVPDQLQDNAYADTALQIGWDQTISQPYIVAYMTEAMQIPTGGKVLEIGTGSGYQAAVLAEIARAVYTIEIVPQLAEQSGRILDQLGYDAVHTRVGDGYRGWPEQAPFDAIIVTAAPDHVPPALVEQLAVGARLIIPVGRFSQDMRIVTKTADGSTSETTIPVRFVPMTGEAVAR